MRLLKLLVLLTLATPHCGLETARASGTLEAFTGIGSSRFSEGVNLTGNKITADVSAEWSANNGGFASVSCFINEGGQNNAIQRGCDASAGWFVPITKSHAVSAAISRHDYSSPGLRGWQYTDVSVDWHIGKNHTFKAKASDSLLGQNHNSITGAFFTSRALNDNWRLNFEAGVTRLQDSAPVRSLEYGVVGLEYSRGRWVGELKTMLSSSDYKRFVKLDFEQPAVGLSLRYRLY